MSKPPAIFYAPHSDDSYLSMSTDIVRHIDAGRNIVVVLMTSGASQYMLDVLNGNADTYEGHRHNPENESYHVKPLTLNEVQEIRQKEFLSEIGAYRHYANGRVFVGAVTITAPEGLTVNDAEQIISGYELLNPGASHKVMTYLDSHNDHKNMGIAAQSLKQRGVITDVRYYVKLADQGRSDIQAKNPMTNRPTAAQKVAIERAGRPFRAWNPAGGSYAFGYHSVKPSFDAIATDPKSVVHQ